MAVLSEKAGYFWIDLEDPYGKSKKEKKRPKYINEAFWESEIGAEDFRQWLLSGEGSKYRTIWKESVTDHSVLRYVEYAPP